MSSHLKSRQPNRAPLNFDPLECRKLLSTLVGDVEKLIKDEKAIHASSQVTPAEIQAVNADFVAIAKVATRPSSSSVSALEAEVKSIHASGKITPSETIALKKDVTAVLTSAGIPMTLATQTSTDINAVITASGVTKAQVKTLSGDVVAIFSDVKALKK